MKKRQVNVMLKDFARLPIYSTENAAGADLYSANVINTIVYPNECKLIPTGICLEMPEDAEGTIRPRSGLSLKGIVVVLGTIDSDYQGEIGIIVHNISDSPFLIERGTRLAQIVFNGDGGLFQADWNEVSSFQRNSKRGDGGFGHTGEK